MFSHADSAIANGIRFFLLHNSGNPILTFGADSSGFTYQPSRTANATAANYIAYGSYHDVAVTWNGGLAASGIHLYRGTNGTPFTEVTGTYTSTDGLTAILGPAGQNITLGNSPPNTRAFNGDIFYICRWNRVLAYAVDLRMAQKHGPLSVRDGLVFCWANGRDWGPSGMNPSVVTAISPGAPSSFAPYLHVGRDRRASFRGAFGPPAIGYAR